MAIELNFEIKRGGTFNGADITFKDSNGDLFPLAGWSAMAQVRKDDRSPMILDLSPRIADDDAIGLCTIPGLSWLVTNGLSGGVYRWDLTLIDPAGGRHPGKVFGSFKIDRVITQTDGSSPAPITPTNPPEYVTITSSQISDASATPANDKVVLYSGNGGILANNFGVTNGQYGISFNGNYISVDTPATAGDFPYILSPPGVSGTIAVLPPFATNAAALAGGLTASEDIYWNTTTNSAKIVTT